MTARLRSPDSVVPAEDLSQIDQIVEQIGDLVEAGRVEDVEHLIAAHPEYAVRLRQLLPAIEALAVFDEASGESLIGATNSARQLGDFRIEREIGRGGMGVVYEAEQLSLGRRVALKVLPFAAMLDKQQLARFKNEARAAATLDHPNIVAIYSVGVERSVHFYAMHLV